MHCGDGGRRSRHRFCQRHGGGQQPIANTQRRRPCDFARRPVSRCAARCARCSGALGFAGEPRRSVRPQGCRARHPKNTKLIWAETPSNPQLKINDLAALAEMAHSIGALCACDNTWATPLLQQPLALGCDVVWHSTTKYFGGHSDVLGGMVVVKKENGELAERLRQIQWLGGGVPSPFDCWLLQRSIPTMPLRVRAQTENAMQVAQWLEDHRA
ncbi:MAG: PLP-dependent transferase [Rhodospirillales bacterium]|nr:PLP-dependent transferase [Rhodospirillales bacterium]